MTGNFMFCHCKRQLLLFFALVSVIFSFGQNAIVTENALPGNPASEWDISGSGSSTLQGFGTDISVNKGERINFKIKTSSVFTYTIKIYRLGYYQGNGARLIANIGTVTGTVQPTPITNTQTGLVDCGNWSISSYWDVPSTAVSGVYIARLTKTGSTSTASHIVFIVRDDASHSDLFFQTSDATWQAYNAYGGNSLYVGATSYPQGHASKVSYNRPFITRDGGGGGGAMMDWLFNAEYPMIRFIERNGYDVTYTTNMDQARRGNLILNHKIFLSVGHDEYWSAEQRNNVEAARSAGINLAFFSGNEVYWKTRWENSVDGTNTPYRTLVCYKEGTMGEYVCGNKCDPTAAWTGLWRDGCSYPSAGGCNPENALTTQISWTESTGSIKVGAAYKSLPFWRNTSVATLTGTQSVTLPSGVLGYEWDPEQFTSSYPSNRVVLSSTTLSGLTHKLAMYTHSSGAIVFGAGTCQWSWGLDNKHDRGSAAASVVMQQATVNLFGDMGAQPASLMSGLVPATSASTAPTIGTQPSAQSVCAGSNVSFTSSATGSPTPTVQWQVNTSGTWVNVTGGTTSTLTFATTIADNGEQYRAVWTNSKGSATSNAVTLTVKAVPTAPTVGVVNNCSNSVLTAGNYTGTLLWSNAATSSSITVTTAATYTVTQTVNSCTSLAGTGIAAPSGVGIATPTIAVVNNCGNSVLTAGNYTGPLSWSNGSTDPAITVTTGGTYTVTQLINGCTSAAGSGVAAPKSVPSAPGVIVTDNCGSSTLIAGNYTGTLLWSNGLSTPSITVTTAATYTVTQTVNGCISGSGSGTATPKVSDATAPTVEVVNNCGNSVLTASDYTGTLLWSNGSTAPFITVSVAGTYTVTQNINGCPGPAGTGIAAPLNSSVPAPTVSVVNSCGSSQLTASNYTGDLLWSTGEAMASIIVTSGGPYTVTQSLNGCSSTAGSGTAAPGDPVTSKPTITAGGVTTFCQGGSVTLTSSLAIGNLWSTGATTKSITVSSAGNYSVTNTNAGSCPVASDVVSVTVNPLPAGSISSPTGTVCENQPASVVFNATSGTAPYKVVISGVTYNNVADGATIVTSTTGGTSTSLWDNTAVPSTPLENDGQPLEVGMKFRSSINGVIKSIRFYKGSNNDGSTYVLKLWQNSNKALLGSVNFSNTTAKGWQTVNLPTPISIVAGTTYVASYYSPSGNYSDNANYFATAARVNGPLTGLKNGTDGTNGVYKYGSGGGFPTSSYQSSNYWVDVVFVTAGNVTLNLTSITDINNCTVSGNLGSVTLQSTPCTLARSTVSLPEKSDIVQEDNPLKVELDQNHPNPFRTSTLIRFGVPATGKVRLTLYDLSGRVVQVLLDEVKDKGFYTIPVQKRDMGSGVYYYKLETGGETLVRKMTLL